MNLGYLNQYVLFAAITVLIGLIICKIICYGKPEMEKYHTGNYKYTCIIILAITGLILRWTLTTKYGERYLNSEPMDKVHEKINKIRKMTKMRILKYIKKIEEQNKIIIPTIPPVPDVLQPLVDDIDDSPAMPVETPTEMPVETPTEMPVDTSNEMPEDATPAEEKFKSLYKKM